MKLTKEKIILLLILTLATILRFWKLSSIPNGLYIDEAAIGYNAYSIMLTGRDEWGKLLPVFLKSFDAYSSPLYAYVTVLSIKVFGLTVFSVRFLSALSGVISVYVFYLLLKSVRTFKHTGAVLIGTFLFAVSPWSIFFSRGAYEANFALALLLLSILLLLKAGRNAKLIIFAFTLLGLSTYAYQAERLLSVAVVAISSTYYVTKKETRKSIVLAIFAYLAILSPQISLLFTKSFASRASGLFYSDVIVSESQKIIALPPIVAKALVFFREFFSQLVTYVNPKNIFSAPDPDLQRSLPELSVLYPWMFVPYAYGFYLISRKFNKYLLLYILIVLSASVPALTRDPFSTLRSLQLFPLYIFIITIGIDRLLSQRYKLTLLFVAIFSVLSAVSLWRSYFVLFPAERAELWGYGYREISDFALNNPKEHVLVDTSRIKPPYILLAYYMKFPPSEFQNKYHYTGNYYSLDTTFDNNYKFANIETRPINWQEDVYTGQVLIGDALSISESQAREHHLSQVLEVLSPAKKVLFVGFRTNPHAKCESIRFQNPHCASIIVR